MDQGDDNTTKPEQEPGTRPGKRRGRVLSALLWLVLFPLSLLAGFGWMLGGSVFFLDLLATYQILLAWGVLACAILGVLLGRRQFGLAVLVVFAVAMWPIVNGRGLRLPDVDLATKGDGAIRVVSCNINPKSEFWEEDLETLMDLDADVIVLIEVPPKLNVGIIRQRLELGEYGNPAHRKWIDNETSPGYILSRWALTRLDTGPDPLTAQHVLHVRVDTPQGEIVVALVHPLSPRSKQRWTEGNTAVELQARAIERTMRESGLPMVIGADLNATPAQLRSRLMRRSGAAMSKPLLRAGGSFPAGRDIPGFLMIQIDDVWHAGDIRPVAWGMLTLRGSDHRAIVVDYVLPSD